MKKNKQIDIKRALALARAFYFLLSCSKACLLPFLTLYFRQLGLSPAMTGVVMGSKHLVSLVWRPLASLLAERYNKRQAVINGSIVCSAAVALLLLLFPPVGVRTHISACNTSDPRGHPGQSLSDNQLTRSPGTQPERSTAPGPQSATATAADADRNSGSAPATTHFTRLSRHGDEWPGPTQTQTRPAAVDHSGLVEPTAGSSAASSASSPSAARGRNKRSKAKSGSEEAPEQLSRFNFLGSLKTMDAKHQLFFMTIIAVCAWELAAAPLQWTADDGLYDYLDFADASDHYSSGGGAWGLLGAACGVGGAALLVSRLSCVIVGRILRSAAHFFCYAGVAALALPVATVLPLHLNKRRDRASRLLKALQLVRGSPRALLCAVTTVMLGIAGSAVDDFLLWQMQDHGSGELHMGLSLAAALLSQAAFPLLVGRVSRLLSPGRVLAVGAASLGLQCLYYSFLWGPWAALPAQVLSCLSSGAVWWAVKVQCDEVATPGVERSVRRVYGSLSLSLGNSLGSFAGGFVAQRFGLAWLFRGAAAAMVAWCACLPLLQWKAPRQRRINYSRLLAADASESSESGSDQDWLDKAMEDDRGKNSYGRRMNQWALQRENRDSSGT